MMLIPSPGTRKRKIISGAPISVCGGVAREAMHRANLAMADRFAGRSSTVTWHECECLDSFVVFRKTWSYAEIPILVPPSQFLGRAFILNIRSKSRPFPFIAVREKESLWEEHPRSDRVAGLH